MRGSLWLCLCALPLFPGSVAGNSLIQIPPSLTATEGQRVEIRCQYSTSYTSYALAWYQELPGKEPLFLLRRYSSGSEHKSDSLARRFSSQLDTGAKSFKLTIDRAEGADSAVYSCALWDAPCCRARRAPDTNCRGAVSEREANTNSATSSSFASSSSESPEAEMES